MSNNANIRRTVFIKKAFQGRFILNMFLLILLSGLCSAALIYWLTGGDLLAQSLTAHESIKTALDHLGFSIVIANLAALLVAGVTTITMVLYASHKIAGPLYRFEKICEQIGEGNLDTVTTLREGDQLQDMGRAFHDMVGKLRNRKTQRLELIAEATDRLDRLPQDQTLSAAQLEHIARIRQIPARLPE
jgi:nitrate/nitrite-specific signal transduction histidine kinase